MKIKITTSSLRVYKCDYDSVSELLHACAMSQVSSENVVDLIGMATFFDLTFKDNSTVMSHILNPSSFNGLDDATRIKVLALLYDRGVFIDYIKVATYNGVVLDYVFTHCPPDVYIDSNGYLLEDESEVDILTLIHQNCNDLRTVKKVILDIAKDFDTHKKGMMDLPYDTLIDVLELTYIGNESTVLYMLKETITDTFGVLVCPCILDHLCIRNKDLLANITEYVSSKLSES